MENLRGAAFMVFAMLSFAIEDALIKLLAVRLPAGQVVALICLGGFLAFLVWARLRGQPLWSPAYLNGKVILRSLSEVVGTCLIASALALIPLTTVSAVIQATPLVVATGAALFLGQEVGWRRWLAILVGFAGVLIIVRPGMDGFVPATLLAVAGMLGLAARDLLTRSLRVPLSGVQLGIHAFALVTPAGFLLAWAQGQPLLMPEGGEWFLLGLSVVIGMIAYLAIIAATRSGNAGIISSFRYSRMVFALVIGYLLFAEIPDTATLVGATIVIASGVYTLWREARLHRASLRAKPAL